MNCSICYDNFDESEPVIPADATPEVSAALLAAANKTKQVCCAQCNNSCCRDCLEQYLLSRGDDVICFNKACAVPWSADFVDANTSAAFRNGDLRAQRTKFLVDCEKSRLPEFQQRAIFYIKASDELAKLEKVMAVAMKAHDEHPVYKKALALEKEMWAAYNKYNNNRESQTARKEFEDANSANAAFRKKNEALLSTLDRDLRVVKGQNIAPWVRAMVKGGGAPIVVTGKRSLDGGNALYGEGSGWRAGDAPAGATQVRRQVLRGCPAEACRGFLNGAGTCGMCATTVCLSCHGVLCGAAEDHICDFAMVETVRLLNQTTRPCPSCAVSITKIDGCDQMWCTQCQTTFSWRTGQKSVGAVHNPHYFEWIRRAGAVLPRQPGDVAEWGPGEAPPAAGQADCCRPDTEIVRQTWMADPRLNYVPVAAEVESMFADLASSTKVDVAKNILSFYYRKIIEAQAQGQMVPLNAQTNQDHQDKLAKINVIYLSGQVDENEWKRRLYLEKRAMARSMEFREIMRTFYAAARDVINAFSLGRGREGAPKARATVKVLVELVTFSIEASKRCAERFIYSGCHAPRIIPNGADILASTWNNDSKKYIITVEMPDELKPVAVFEVLSLDAFTKITEWLVDPVA